MPRRFAILAALFVTLSACQSLSASSGGTGGEDCSSINESNRERCQTGI